MNFFLSAIKGGPFFAQCFAVNGAGAKQCTNPVPTRRDGVFYPAHNKKPALASGLLLVVFPLRNISNLFISHQEVVT